MRCPYQNNLCIREVTSVNIRRQCNEEAEKCKAQRELSEKLTRYLRDNGRIFYEEVDLSRANLFGDRK